MLNLEKKKSKGKYDYCVFSGSFILSFMFHLLQVLAQMSFPLYHDHPHSYLQCS